MMFEHISPIKILVRQDSQHNEGNFTERRHDPRHETKSSLAINRDNPDPHHSSDEETSPGKSSEMDYYDRWIPTEGAPKLDDDKQKKKVSRPHSGKMTQHKSYLSHLRNSGTSVRYSVNSIMRGF